MVDAFTFTKSGQSHSFASRAEMFGWMIENGELFLDGETAQQMLAFAKKKLGTLDTKSELYKAYSDAVATLDEHVF